jgi:hypothetical protein
VTALQSCNDVFSALTAFERERIPVNQRIMARAAAERHHTPEAVMSEIAVLDFLQG